MATHRTRVALPVSPRAPEDEKGLLAWFKREGHQLIRQIRDVINWITGKVCIDQTDCDASGHDFLDVKLLVDSTMTKTVSADHSTLTLGVDPDSIPDMEDHKVSTDATDEADGGYDYLFYKLLAGSHVSLTVDTSGGLRRVSIAAAWPTVPVASETLPQPLGEAALGDEGKWADGKHVHPREPTPATTSVYYASPEDSPSEDQSLQTECPTSLDSLQVAFEGITNPVFIEAGTMSSVPGLVTWPGGNVNIVIRAKVLNPQGAEERAVSIDLWRVPLVGDPVRYLDEPLGSYPDIVQGSYLTDSIQVYTAQVPVVELVGTSTDRLVAYYVGLPGIGGGDPLESLYIETGADGSTVMQIDATQIQGLFSPTSGILEHNDLTGRDVDYDDGGCHPADAIGPGRLHRNMGTIAVDANGVLTFPTDASQGRVELGAAPLSGIVATGVGDGDHLLVFVTNSTYGSPKNVIDGASVAAPGKLLRLPAKAGGAQPLQLKGPSALLFWYDGAEECFRLKEAVTYVA